MTSQNRTVYVPIIGIFERHIELISADGTKKPVRGPGEFFVVGKQGKVCCLGLVIESDCDRFHVRFRSGEQHWVRIEDPIFPPEYNSPEVSSAA